MTDLSNLIRQEGTKKSAKRLGRGRGSGKGMHTVGKGQKGQLSRTGHSIPIGFEGGQVPLHKRLPHIGGFRNPRYKNITSVSLSVFNGFRKGSKVTPADLVKTKIIKSPSKHGVKIILKGNLEKNLKFEGFLMSEGARRKIEESGSEILNA